MNDILWTLDHVSLGQRLRDVTLRLSGGVTAVLGPSGAGKTSLLNLLVAFERPDAGALTTHFSCGSQGRSPSRVLASCEPVAATVRIHARPIFWAPQGEGLWPHLTVREHVAVMGGNETDALLAEFALTDRAAARPGTLSQGERARLAVARALAADAEVLVMDEPLAHVDPARVGRFWEALSRRLAQSGTSLIFATHAPGTVLAEAQQVICLRDGCVVYAGGVKELYETPATAELAACLGEMNWLEPSDARVWLQRETPAARCFRPEQMVITPATIGTLVVECARFQGAVAEVVLRHEPSGAVKRFWHRPVGNLLRKGMRVQVIAVG